MYLVATLSLFMLLLSHILGLRVPFLSKIRYALGQKQLFLLYLIIFFPSALYNSKNTEYVLEPKTLWCCLSLINYWNAESEIPQGVQKSRGIQNYPLLHASLFSVSCSSKWLKCRPKSRSEFSFHISSLASGMPDSLVLSPDTGKCFRRGGKPLTPIPSHINIGGSGTTIINFVIPHNGNRHHLVLTSLHLRYFLFFKSAALYLNSFLLGFWFPQLELEVHVFFVFLQT